MTVGDPRPRTSPRRTADPGSGPEQRTELMGRVRRLSDRLHRTRFTVSIWLVGVIFFLWLGMSGGNLAAGLILGALAATAAGVTHGGRKRQLQELQKARRQLHELGG